MKPINFSAGKLKPSILNQNVLRFTGAINPNLLVGGGLGEDAALIRVPSGILVAASDPVTGAVQNAGRLLVHINANDLACKGADPEYIIITLIVPAKMGADFIAEIMQEIHDTCLQLNIAIAGGHTELTEKYSTPVISAAMLGMTKYSLSTQHIHHGDTILATGHTGLEGMSIIAHDKPQLFAGIFSPEELDTIRSWQRDLSVLRPAKILREYAHYMHDPTEGGLYGALCETAQACGLGVELFAENIPVHPFTVRAAQKIGFSPMNLISSGMLTAVIPEGRVSEAQAALYAEGIPSAVIGRFVNGKGNAELDTHEELWGILGL